MFHYFLGKKQQIGSAVFLTNDAFWIQVSYQGKQTEGAYFLYPYLDESKKTIAYYAFDTAEEKEIFETMIKIGGVWPKTAFQIAQLPSNTIKDAIEALDPKCFQSIPGIGPKLAKKIILELKGNFALSEAEGIDTKHKVFLAVVKSLKNLGYDANRVKEVLKTYPWSIEQDEPAVIIKWVIKAL